MDQPMVEEYEKYQKQGKIWGDIDRDRIRKLSFPRVDQSVIQAFLAVDDLTSTVSDVLDSMGLNGVIPASYLVPVLPDRKIAGTAVTLRSIPERKTWTQGHIDRDVIRMAIRDVYFLAEPGDVLVADYGGDLEVSNMGGQSTALAKARGLAASICNGAVRDISTIRALDHPVWSRGRTPMTGKFRIEAIEINGPVALCGVQVIAGDLIIADDSGVCVVPIEAVASVLEKVKSIAMEEADAYELIRKNAPVAILKPLYRKRYRVGTSPSDPR